MSIDFKSLKGQKFHPKIGGVEDLRFHGLSSPDDLKEMWRILKRDSDTNDLNVIWDYEQPSQLEPGFNIVNILYSRKTPDETGHYCLIYVDKHTKSVIFFNPVGNYSDMNADKLMDLYNYFVKREEYPEKNVMIDLSGKQSATSDNCGYHCLAKAFTIYTDNEGITFPNKEIENLGGKKDMPSDTPEELLYSILKNVRGIYFGLRDGWENSAMQKKKKEKASGLADYVKPGEKWSYSRLRDFVENEE